MSKKNDGINMDELIKAINEIEKKENISKDFLLESLEVAIEAAYKEHYETEEDVKVIIDREKGNMKILATKIVAEKVENKITQISKKDANKINKKAKIGDTIDVEVNPKDFGRIAAGKGKQMIIQRLREKEKEVRYDEYSNKIGEVITGLVQKAEGGIVVLDLGKLEGVMPLREQVPSEQYYVNQRLRVYVKNVGHGARGDVQVLVSRAAEELVQRLFEYEIPEIDEGLIEIKAVSRDPGLRSKVAVYSSNENIDPVGSCVGQKGIRIQNIVDELNGEKIDVVEWNENPATFIASALLPAEVMAIDIDEENKFAQVIVEDSQLSLAIGKAGQNVRLAVALTGYKIDIKSESQFRQIIEDMQNQKKENIEIEEIEDEDEEDNENTKTEVESD